MRNLVVLAVLASLLGGCSWANHAMGRQADNRVGALYFNGTVLEDPIVSSADPVTVLVKIIGTLKKGTEGEAVPQLITISCKGDPELIGRCLKAKPGLLVKANGYLAQTGGLVVNADYFAIK